MEKAWFKYVIKYWNDLDEKNEICSGLCRGDSFHSAVKKIEKFYGDELEAILNLEWIDDSSVIEVEKIKEKFELN